MSLKGNISHSKVTMVKPKAAPPRPRGRPRKVPQPPSPSSSDDDSSSSDSGSDSSSRSPSPKRREATKKKASSAGDRNPPRRHSLEERSSSQAASPSKKKKTPPPPPPKKKVAPPPPMKRRPLPPPPPMKRRASRESRDRASTSKGHSQHPEPPRKAPAKYPSTDGEGSSTSDSDSDSGSDYDDGEDTPPASDEDSDEEQARLAKAMRRSTQPVVSGLKNHNELDMPGFHMPLKPSIWILTGKPASGKSYMMRYLMYEYCRMGHFTGGGWVYSPTSFNGDYDWMPKEKVIPKYEQAHLEQYINHLRQLTEAGKAEHGKDWQLKPNFVIFDDCLGLLKQTEWFNGWVANYRHTNTSIFILQQFLAASRSVSTLLRNCTSIAMMWPSILKHNVDACYRAYGGVAGLQENFEGNFLNPENAAPYSCLVYKANCERDYTYVRAGAGETPDDFKMIF